MRGGSHPISFSPFCLLLMFSDRLCIGIGGVFKARLTTFVEAKAVRVDDRRQSELTIGEVCFAAVGGQGVKESRREISAISPWISGRQGAPNHKGLPNLPADEADRVLSCQRWKRLLGEGRRRRVKMKVRRDGKDGRWGGLESREFLRRD